MSSVALKGQKVAERLPPSLVKVSRERAYLLDWSEALEMDAGGGADATQCGYCDRYDCMSRCAEAMADRAADEAYDSEAL